MYSIGKYSKHCIYLSNKISCKLALCRLSEISNSKTADVIASHQSGKQTSSPSEGTSHHHRARSYNSAEKYGTG